MAEFDFALILYFYFWRTELRLSTIVLILTILKVTIFDYEIDLLKYKDNIHNRAPF